LRASVRNDGKQCADGQKKNEISQQNAKNVNYLFALTHSRIGVYLKLVGHCPEFVAKHQKDTDGKQLQRFGRPTVYRPCRVPIRTGKSNPIISRGSSV